MKRTLTYALLLIVVLITTSCAPPPQPESSAAPTSSGAVSTPTTATTTLPTTTETTHDGVDLTHLPIGDGNYSLTSAAVGSVWTCNRPNPNAGGASVDGPWIHSDGTYDFTTKAVVDGENSWSPQLSITLQGSVRTLVSNLLPNHLTGTYPIGRNDDAYQYDRNPNKIKTQSLTKEIPANPTVAAQPRCVPMGAIGLMVTGGVFFNALDGPGRDAAAHETLDLCQGHPERTGEYHYHSLSTCIEAWDTTTEGHSALVGYAFDGFGIYGHRGENGETLTNADLDECHGHTHAIEWDGQTVVMYHYHATWEYPYTLGCYKG